MLSTDHLNEYSFYLSANDLPSGWSIASLEDVSTKVTDGTHKTPKYQNSGVRFISIKNIRAFKPIDFSVYEKYISEAEHKELTKRCKPEFGDILFPRIGTLGFAKRIDFPDEVSIFVGLGLIKPNRSVIDERFLEFFMNTLYISNLSAEKANGSGRMTLPLEQTRRFPVPVPPINEQCRIVEKIETLFARLDKGEEALREVQKLLARYRQSVLKAAVTGQLTADWRAENTDCLEHGRDLLARILQTRRETWQGRGRYKDPVVPDSADLPELPDGWVWATTEQLAFVETGATPKKGNTEYYLDGKVPWITSTAVNEEVILSPQDHITETALARTNAKVFRSGSLIVAMYGEGRTRGKVSELGIDAATNQACAALLVSHLPPSIKSLLKRFYQYNYEAIRLSSSGGVQPNLNLGVIKSTWVPLPSEQEAQEILDRLDIEMRRIEFVNDLCRTEAARSAGLRRSILKEAFAGRLIPQDPADEPAADLLARIKETRTATSRKPRRKARA